MKFTKEFTDAVEQKNRLRVPLVQRKLSFCYIDAG